MIDGALRTELLRDLESVMGQVRFRDLSTEEVAALLGIMRGAADRQNTATRLRTGRPHLEVMR